ncbi:SMI1/KNR4 family protein [Bacillus sp. ILBB4]|nr:SMI1/KNR4 family protein [Bacillus sp. ILBB4]
MDKLINVLQPPENPHSTGDKARWTTIFSLLETKLPSDYIKFIETYGTGGIDNFLWILTPFVNDEHVNLFLRQKEVSRAYSQSKLKFPQYYKRDVYPETGGILPWGYTENGDELYCLTEGSLDEWKVVVYESGSSENYIYSLSMTDFLYQIITKKLACDVFLDDFPSDVATFISVNVD